MAEVVALITIIKTAFLCYDEETEVEKEGGETVSVKDLLEGDKILSQRDGKKFYDKVTNVTTIEGKVTAHKLEFSNGKSITVTSPHLMMIWKENEMQSIAAMNVQVHDVMQMENGQYSKVTRITNTVLDRKVNVNTQEGLMYANGIFTTGMCENIPTTNATPASQVQMQYMAAKHDFLSTPKQILEA